MTPNTIILSNLMNIRMHHSLGSYELAAYQQLLVTVKTQARLDEIIAHTAIKDVQDGQRTNQTSGRVSPPTTEASEHRGNDPTSTV